MTKQEELQVLRDTVTRLGPDSYCGPWLSSQLDAIESAMGADVCPSVYALSLPEAQRKSLELVTFARAEAERLIERAKKDADTLRAEARRQANSITESAASALRSALSRLS